MFFPVCASTHTPRIHSQMLLFILLGFLFLTCFNAYSFKCKNTKISLVLQHPYNSGNMENSGKFLLFYKNSWKTQGYLSFFLFFLIICIVFLPVMFSGNLIFLLLQFESCAGSKNIYTCLFNCNILKMIHVFWKEIYPRFQFLLLYSIKKLWRYRWVCNTGSLLSPHKNSADFSHFFRNKVSVFHGPICCSLHAQLSRISLYY